MTGRLRSPFKHIGKNNIVSAVDTRLIVRAARLAAGEEPGNLETAGSSDTTVAAFQSSI